MLGAFGDSITTAPSYADPLAVDLNVGYDEIAVGGYRTDQILALATPARISQVSHSIILAGINDVLQDVAAATIEANLTTLMGLVPNPVVCTLLPFGNYASWTSDREAVRVAVNTWIKANVANHVDVEAVMGDEDPTQPVLLASFDSGDGLHPNEAGYEALAEAMFAQGYGSMVLA